jgi:hypothetical protein
VFPVERQRLAGERFSKPDRVIHKIGH